MPSSRAFTVISWGVTFILVAALLGFAYVEIQSNTEAHPIPTPMPTAEPSTQLESVALPAAQPLRQVDDIQRGLIIKTNIPERPRYETIRHTVMRGDSVFAIAKEFNVTPETLLWANYDSLNDDPHALRPGQVLNVPPVNGVFYQWQEGDSLESVADKFKASVDDILNWPGNKLDLTNPVVQPGQWVMVPNGKREFKQWIIPTIASGRSGTAQAGGSACAGGAVGSGAFIWPADNRYLSGNDYWSGHLAIDIAAGEGAPVYAADSGVVTMSAGGWNYGYGNVIQIDHGNGYATLYAHLSQRNVSVCQSVSRGQLIGLAGNTGNSFGAHLHFEVRQGGGFVNPWYVLP